MALGEIAGSSGQSRAGKMAPSCPLGQPITVRDLVHLARSRSQPYNKYGLLTKCEVKMAGYWPSSFFACLWTETSINWQKRTRPISSNLDRTNLVNKGFIIWLQGKFGLRDAAGTGNPERSRWVHLARSGSQSQRAIWFILPAHGASHIINCVLGQVALLSECYAQTRCIKMGTGEIRKCLEDSCRG